jgi:hypothetical protein
MRAVNRAKLVLAASCAVLGGCAGMGGNQANESLAAARTVEATPPAVSFAQADLDGDARITQREFELWRRKSDEVNGQAAAGGTAGTDAFYAADRDLNGVLTLDEWQTMIGNPSRPVAGASRSSAPARP